MEDKSSFYLFPNLPGDLRKIQFLEYLPIRDLISYSKTNSEYFILISEPKLWRKLLVRDFNINYLGSYPRDVYRLFNRLQQDRELEEADDYQEEQKFINDVIPAITLWDPYLQAIGSLIPFEKFELNSHGVISKFTHPEIKLILMWDSYNKERIDRQGYTGEIRIITYHGKDRRDLILDLDGCGSLNPLGIIKLIEFMRSISSYEATNANPDINLRNQKIGDFLERQLDLVREIDNAVIYYPSGKLPHIWSYWDNSTRSVEHWFKAFWSI